MTAATAVRERGITFSAPMIQALLREANPKWQTRRLIKPAPVDMVQFIGADNKPTWEYGWCSHPRVISKHITCPYGKPGDRLYVREAWRTGKQLDSQSPAEIGAACIEAGYAVPGVPISYEADGEFRPWGDSDREDFGETGRYRNARFMPRWASRITLEITEVRVQQLQEIGEADARAEGIEEYKESGLYRNYAGSCEGYPSLIKAIHSFETLWDSIHGTEHPWASNPWVFAISFRRI